MGTAEGEGTLDRDNLLQNQNNNNPSQNQFQGNMSYIWATDDSFLSNNVDRWIAGDTSPRAHAEVQPSRLGPLHRDRSALDTTPPSLGSSGLWYLAALVLPLVNVSRGIPWRCSPSTVFNTVELVLSQVAGYCNQARTNLRRLTRDQGAREMFAGAMDIILIVYALGFLLLSMYQASLLHQF